MKPLLDLETSAGPLARRALPRGRITRTSVCHFQAIDHNLAGGGVRKRRERSPSLRAFREVSARYVREEAPPHSRTEVLLFVFISSIAAWPIVGAILMLLAFAPA